MAHDPEDGILPHEQADEPERGHLRRRRQLGAVGLAVVVGIATTAAYQGITLAAYAAISPSATVVNAGPLLLTADTALLAMQVLPFLAISAVLGLRLPGDEPKWPLGALAAALLWMLPVYFPAIMAGPGGLGGAAPPQEWLFYASFPVLGGIAGGALADAWRRRHPARGAGAALDIAAGPLFAVALYFCANALVIRRTDAEPAAALSGVLAGATAVVLARGHVRALASVALSAGTVLALVRLVNSGALGLAAKWSSWPMAGPALLSGTLVWSAWRAVAVRRAAPTPRNHEVA